MQHACVRLSLIHTLSFLMSDDPDKMPRFMISYLDLQCEQAVRRYA